MRLGLEVVRHQLPSIKVLWQANPEHTVAEFLHSVDQSIPLETQDWSLEDYAVETLEGYEILHYYFVGKILKDDEHIRIRPLSTTDVRARRITGRSQIHANGIKLLDGVPFGRPPFSRRSRPDIHIPSRERLSYGSANVYESSDMGGSDDEEADDDDYEMIEDADGEGDGLGTDGGGEGEIVLGHFPGHVTSPAEAAPSRRSRRLKLARLDTPEDTPGQSRALVLHTNPEEGPYEEVSDKGMTGRAKLDRSRSSSKKVHWSNMQSSDLKSYTDFESDSVSSISSSDSGPDLESVSDTESESEAESTSDSGDDSPDEVYSDAPPAKRLKMSQGTSTPISQPVLRPSKPDVPPGKGKQSTKKRNERRKLAVKLQRLKRDNVLPANAGRAQLMHYLETGHTHYTTIADVNSHAGSQPMEEIMIDSANSSDDIDSSSESESSDSDSDSSESEDEAPEVLSSQKPKSEPAVGSDNAKTSNSDADAEFQKRREALLQQINAGGVDVTEPATSTLQNNSDISTSNGVTEPTEKRADIAHEETPKRKPRLNLGASQRLLLGSLGHRAPRNATERAALTAKLEVQAQKKAITNGAAKREQIHTAATQEDETTTDPDYWKSRIELTAVECCEEDVQLSTPPFPFYQRWDKSQQRCRKRKRNKYIEREEQQDSYFDDSFADGDALNYDDEDAGEADGDDLNYGDQDAENETDFAGFPDTEEQEEDEEDDMPALPSDPTILPAISEEEIETNDIILFTTLEVSASTNWQPEMVQRTAQVMNETLQKGDELVLKLARRDLPKVRYDEEGKRRYEKFEMQREDDEETEDGGLVRYAYEGLVGVRLLKRVEEGANEAV